MEVEYQVKNEWELFLISQRRKILRMIYLKHTDIS